MILSLFPVAPATPRTRTTLYTGSHDGASQDTVQSHGGASEYLHRRLAAVRKGSDSPPPLLSSDQLTTARQKRHTRMGQRVGVLVLKVNFVSTLTFPSSNNPMDRNMNVFLLISFSTLAILAIHFFTHELSITHARSVQISSLCFSGGISFGTLVSLFAHYLGAVDKHGMYQGVLGVRLKSLLDIMLDLNGEVTLALLAFLVVVVPQIISYLIGSIFGVASKILFLSLSLKLTVWTLIKAYYGTAGIYLSMELFGLLYRWSDFDSVKSVAVIPGSLVLAAFASFLLNVRCSFSSLSGKTFPLARLRRRFHKYSTRNLRRLYIAEWRKKSRKA